MGIGSRPRHAAFSADGTTLFVLHEFNNVLTMHAFDASTSDVGPVLAMRPTFSYDPERPPAGCFHAGAEITLHHSGRVFASTRGVTSGFDFKAPGQSFVRSFASGKEDDLMVFQDVVTPDNPRHFQFDQQGRWMLVTTTGGFTSFPISEEGELGLPVESRLADIHSEMKLDCIALVER